MFVSQAASANPTRYSTLPLIQNISDACSGSEKVMRLTVEQWGFIEAKMGRFMNPILAMKERPSLSQPFSLPTLTRAELIGLKEWMDTVTLPRKMATFMMEYRYPLAVSQSHLEDLHACYQKAFSSIKNLTDMTLSFLTKYLNFLHSGQGSNCNEEKRLEEENGQSCAQKRVYNATLEEWDSIVRNAQLFAQFVRENRVGVKIEGLKPNYSADHSIELPLFTQMEHEGLREWVHLLTSPEGLKKLISTKHCPCYLKGIEKINLILKLIIETIEWRLKFLMNKRVDFNDIFTYEMFPRREEEIKIPKNQEFNVGINLCHSTKRNLGICLEQKEGCQASIRRVNQKLNFCEFDLKVYRLEQTMDQDACRKTEALKRRRKNDAQDFGKANRRASQMEKEVSTTLEEANKIQKKYLNIIYNLTEQLGSAYVNP